LKVFGSLVFALVAFDQDGDLGECVRRSLFRDDREVRRPTAQNDTVATERLSDGAKIRLLVGRKGAVSPNLTECKC